MNEAEWLDADAYAQNQFLMSLGEDSKLQLFLCSCCRRLDSLLDDEARERVSRMAGYYKPSRDEPLGNVWDVFRNAVDAAERYGKGLATRDECKAAAEAAQNVSQHFGDIAACAPIPGEDPIYDDAAVMMGSDAAGAAECAASLHPSAAELCVRVVATFSAYDNGAYYEGAHSEPGFDPEHPHLLARRAERTEQWRLLEDIFGKVSDRSVDVGSCVFSGAQTEFRLANGDFVWEPYVEEFQNKGWLNEELEYTDSFFRDHPELRKVVGEDGHLYIEGTSAN